MKARGDAKPLEHSQTLRHKRTVPATTTFRKRSTVRIPYEWTLDESRTSPTLQRSRQCSWLNVATHDQQKVLQSTNVPRKAYVQHLRVSLDSRLNWTLLINLLRATSPSFFIAVHLTDTSSSSSCASITQDMLLSSTWSFLSINQYRKRAIRSAMTLYSLLADKFVGGILVRHVIPSLRLLRRDLFDVHRLSSDPRHRCAKDLIPTLFVSLRVWGRLALLADLLLVRTDRHILLHWQREHSPDNSSLRRQICKCLE